PPVGVGQIDACFVAVPVGLEEHDVVAPVAQSVDQDAAVAASAVGGVGDAIAEKAPRAVTDQHLVTHQPSIMSASRPLPVRQSNAMSGVPQIGLPLTLSEVLISTGWPVSAANSVSTSARNGFASGV